MRKQQTAQPAGHGEPFVEKSNCREQSGLLSIDRTPSRGGHDLAGERVA
jgi:hypothetical protein